MKIFLSIFIFSTLTLVGCDSSNIKVKSSNSELSKYEKMQKMVTQLLNTI